MKAVLGTTVLVSVLAWTGLAVENAPSEQVRATVKPHSISIVRTRSFDSRMSMNMNQMTVMLGVSLEPGIQAVGWKELTFTEAVTDAGESLELPPEQMMRDRAHLNPVDATFSRYQRDRGYLFYLNVMFKPPVKTCRSIRSLSGTFTLALAKGNLKRAELKPLKDVLGKTLVVDGIPDAEITVDRRAGGIAVTMPTGLQGRFRSVECYDGSGARVEIQPTGGGSNGTQFFRHYNADLADDASVVVLLYPEVATVPVSFQVKDILLPGVDLPAETGGKLTIRAVDVAEPAPPKEADVVPVVPKPIP